jgi:hypothetical protein
MKTLSYVALFVCLLTVCSQELKELDKDSELTVVRTTHTSAGGEIGKAFAAAIGGFIFVLLAFQLLWTNERREAKMWALFGRARSIVKQNVSSGLVDSANEARLVHMVGTLSSEQDLIDSLFGIKVSNCAKLLREVQMYQWIETSQTEERDTMMGGKEKVTTYSYSMDWRSYHVDSSSFQEMGHNNPSFPCESQEVTSKLVNFGAFVLTDRLVDKLYNKQSLKGAELPEKLLAPGVPNLRLAGEHYTSETSVGSPNLGDLRISFHKIPCGDGAILAVQRGNSFAPLTVTMDVQNGRVVWPEGMNASLLDPSAAKDIDLSKLEDGGCCAICNLLGEVVESNEEIYEIAEKKANALEMFQVAQNKQEFIHIILQAF